MRTPREESEGERGRVAPSKGGGRGRGLQAPAPARPREPAGNGESPRRTPHAPQGQRPPRGEPQRGGAREQAPTGQSDAAGRGRREATGEPRAPAPPPEQSERGAGRGRFKRVAQGRARERSERAERAERASGASGQPYLGTLTSSCSEPQSPLLTHSDVSLSISIDYEVEHPCTNNPFHLRPWPTPLPNCIDRAGVRSSSGGYIGRNMDISALLSCPIA